MRYTKYSLHIDMTLTDDLPSLIGRHSLRCHLQADDAQIHGFRRPSASPDIQNSKPIIIRSSGLTP